MESGGFSCLRGGFSCLRGGLSPGLPEDGSMG